MDGAASNLAFFKLLTVRDGSAQRRLLGCFPHQSFPCMWSKGVKATPFTKPGTFTLLPDNMGGLAVALANIKFMALALMEQQE